MAATSDHHESRARTPAWARPTSGAGTSWQQHAAHIAWIVVAGLAAHLLAGHIPYPFGDDYAYAPLAILAGDGQAFPRDDQLRMFANHARIYTLVLEAARATVGTAVGLTAAVLVLCVAAIAAVARIVGSVAPDGPQVRMAALPICLGLAICVVEPGIGRGFFGGYVSPFFHHQFVALVAAAFALGAVLRGEGLIAGICLGVVAWAQPAVAAHASLALGLGFLAHGRAGLRPLALAAISALVVAAPVVLDGIEAMGAAASTLPGLTNGAAFDLLDDAYRFRMPHHYTLPNNDLVLAALYLVLGGVGAMALKRREPSRGRAALGVVAAFGALWLVTAVSYVWGLAEWLPLFVLDATRTSPLWFVFAAAIAAPSVVAAVRSWRADAAFVSNPWTLAAIAAAVAILALNGTWLGAVVCAVGLAIAWPGKAWRHLALLAALVSLVFVGMTLAFRPVTAPRDAAEVAGFDWIRTNTPADALFVIPVGMLEFRLLARRSAYVEFKLFSVAQPDQAALTMARMLEVAMPDAAARAEAGWQAMESWEASQHAAADCAGIDRLLGQTGADYMLLRTEVLAAAHGAVPDCGDAGPRVQFQNDAFTIYGMDTAASP